MTVDDIVHALRSPDAEARRQGVASLAELDDATLRSELLAVLADAEWRVRKEAVNAAAALGARSGVIEVLVSAVCTTDDVGLRNAALEALTRIGEAALPAIATAMARASTSARRFLALALGSMGSFALHTLVELVEDPDPATAQAALESLARVGGASAEEVLVRALAAEDPVRRIAALEGLDALASRVPAASLDPALADPLCRRAALSVLGHSDADGAVSRLAEALEESTGANVGVVAVALARIFDRGGAAAQRIRERAMRWSPAARSNLRALVAVGRDAERRSASVLAILARDALALPRIAEVAVGAHYSAPVLVALREWGEGAVDGLAAAITELEGESSAAAIELATHVADVARERGELGAASADGLAAALVGALASADEARALAAAGTLGGWARPRDAAAVVWGIHNGTTEVRIRAGHALAELARRAPSAVAPLLALEEADPFPMLLLPAVAAIGGEAAIQALRTALVDDDAERRRLAVRALAHLDAQSAAELAAFALADDDVQVQVAAVAALAAARDEAHVGLAALRLSLSADSEPVVIAALRALAELSDRGSAEQLRVKARERGRPGVALAALHALRAINDPELESILDEALRAGDDELVKEALRALRDSTAHAPAARMAKALDHASWDVRQLAARLLGEVGGADARALLERRLATEADELVRASIEESLRKLRT